MRVICMLLLLPAVSCFHQPANMIASARRRHQMSLSSVSQRRDWIASMAAAATTALVVPSLPAFAGIDVSTIQPTGVAMKDFVDPQGLFALRVPKNFFTLRRTQKGDLPDAKTGKGRRGSSIFTAGDMSKAEVVAVERFPTRVLLEENGIQATGDLTTFPELGDARAVANLLVLRREKESQAAYNRVIDNVRVSADGKELFFRVRSEIEVQKPELLQEQYGLSQLFRITLAKVSLKSDDGNIMAIFASALEKDFTNGVDGPALEDTVDSFVAFEQKLSD